MKNLFCFFLAITWYLPNYCQVPAAGNILWLRADRNVFNNNMITHANLGDLVQVWQDQSGNGNHFRQDINSQRPQLVQYANTLCSQPLLHFDVGRRTYLYSGLKIAGPQTIFIVFIQPSISSTPETLISLKSNAGTYSEILCADAPGYSPLSFISEITPSPSGGILTSAVGDNMSFSSTGNIFTMTYNGGANSSPANYCAKNDTVSVPVTSSGLFGRLPMDTTTIGGRAPQQNYSFLSGDIGEIILYNRVLNAVEITQVNSYLAAKFGFFGTCNVLHSAELNFTSRLLNNWVELNWKPCDADVNEYSIEHSSDNVNWDSIGVVKISAENCNNSRYSFIHNSPFSGINYYHLKIKTAGGRILYSSSLKANVAGATTGSYTILPNPVTDHIYIRTATKELLHIKLFNAAGKTVKELDIFSNMPANTGNLRPGIYFAKITGKKDQVTLKFLKQ